MLDGLACGKGPCGKRRQSAAEESGLNRYASDAISRSTMDTIITAWVGRRVGDADEDPGRDHGDDLNRAAVDEDRADREVGGEEQRCGIQ